MSDERVWQVRLPEGSINELMRRVTLVRIEVKT